MLALGLYILLLKAISLLISLFEIANALSRPFSLCQSLTSALRLRERFKYYHRYCDYCIDRGITLLIYLPFLMTKRTLDVFGILFLFLSNPIFEINVSKGFQRDLLVIQVVMELVINTNRKSTFPE